MREILVAVTFRDFVGGYTDEIQKMFIQSIASQTYTKFKLVVTLCGEQNVEKTLEDIGINHVCHQSDSYDWTTVFSNSFQHLEKGKNIILTTNADNIFDPNFLQEIINNFEPGTGGTSYPPFHYHSIEDYKAGKPNNYRDYKTRSMWVDYKDRKIVKYFYQYDPNVIVPECLFIDGDLMLDKVNSKLFLDHLLVGPTCMGNTPSIMAGFYAKRLINIMFKSKVHSLETPANLKQATHDLIMGEKNSEIIYSFFKKRGFNDKLWSGTLSQTAKYFIISQYKVVGFWYQRFAYYLYMAVNTFPFKVGGLWFPLNMMVFPRYIAKNIVLFLSHRKLLPLFVVKIIVGRNKDWKKHFVNY